MFGLFQSTRSKATKLGIAVVLPMLGTIQGLGGPGLPPAMWQDPCFHGATVIGRPRGDQLLVSNGGTNEGLGRDADHQ